MKSFYFNAKRTSDLETYPTGYDRAYDANDRAEYHAPEGTDGVFALTANACQAFVVAGAIVGIHEGFVNYRGYRAHVEGNETVTVTVSGYIAVRWDNTEAVRAFTLVNTPTLLDSDVQHDIPIAQVIYSDGEVSLTDCREYVAWYRLPAYYPPDDDAVPYVFWKYLLGLPMTADERLTVESNSVLMAMYNNSDVAIAAHKGTVFIGDCSGGFTNVSNSTREADATFNAPEFDRFGMFDENHTAQLILPNAVHGIILTTNARLYYYSNGSLSNPASGSSYLSVRQNGVEVARVPGKYIDLGGTMSTVTTRTYVPVSPGGVLTFHLYATASGGGVASATLETVTVEVIA